MQELIFEHLRFALESHFRLIQGDGHLVDFTLSIGEKTGGPLSVTLVIIGIEAIKAKACQRKL